MEIYCLATQEKTRSDQTMGDGQDHVLKLSPKNIQRITWQNTAQDNSRLKDLLKI